MNVRTRRSLFVVGAALCCLVVLAWIGFAVIPKWVNSESSTEMSELQKAALAATMATIGALVVRLVAPLRDELDVAVKDLFAVLSTPACRIFIYGPSGVGKTTLITRIVALRQRAQHASTEEVFNVHKMTAPLDLSSKQEIQVHFSDFRGQRPGKVFTNAPFHFFGVPGRRRINVVLFMVDAFPSYNDEITKRPLSTDQIVSKYGRQAKKIIKERLQEIQEYISQATIETVFELAFSSRNLFAVRLLINKVDLIEALADGGLIDIGEQTAAAYCESLFSSINKHISEACSDNSISDLYSTKLISAEKRTGVDEFITELFDIYKKRTSPG